MEDMVARMSKRQAEACGYMVDTKHYPWIGTKQVSPDGDVDLVPVYTDKEFALLEACRKAYDVIDNLNDHGFGPLTSKEGCDAMSACIDAMAFCNSDPA